MNETQSYSELLEENDRLRARVGELEASVQQLAAAGTMQAMVAQIYGVPYDSRLWHLQPLDRAWLKAPPAVMV